MEWYCWIVIAVGIIVLIKLVAGRRKPEPSGENEISAMFQRSRDEAALADQELAKVVAAIADLFVVAPNSAYANMLSRAGLQSCVSDFMRQAGLTGMRTSTKMLHVVMSPVQITALVKVKPTEPRTAVREFIRIAVDKWAFRTRYADDSVPRTRRRKEVRNCVRDGGRSSGAGCQGQASNHRKLRRSKAGVVSVAEKAGLDPVRYGSERRARANR